MKPYLTEDSLGEILKLIYDEIPIRDKAYPNHRFRPDYRFEKEKVIVEFDGYRHYSVSSVILKDYRTTKLMEEDGYKVIRIPYFVQMSSEIIELLFGKTIDYNQTFPHGFIDKAALLPSDFCSLGVERFMNDLDRFSIIKDDIINSMDKLVSSGKDFLEVYPVQYKR